MEVYILDDLLRRIRVIDRFESLIWTDRMRVSGDFELVLHSTRANKQLLPTGTLLAMNESHHVMILENVEDEIDAEGRPVLKFTGRSLESILENRLARTTLEDLFTNPKWEITGLPKAIAEEIFSTICVEGVLDDGDVIPFITEGSMFPTDTIAAPTEEITYEFEPTDVYTVITTLCEQYGMGLRLVRNYDNSELYFNIYMGVDRTSSQSTYPAVIFSPELENLQNTSEISSIAEYKNVAYVISPAGSEIVYAIGVDPTTTVGLNRRVLFVKAEDIDDVDPGVASTRMIQRGLDELAKNRQIAAFDGEISQSSKYIYGVDYNVGDLIELRTSTGAANKMQVTEQIFASDKEGERRYPTLTLNQFVMPGTWLAWDYNQVWEDLGETEFWEDQ